MNPFAHFQALYGHLELSEEDAALHVFLSGWNTAMHEMMERVNKMPFGNDTRASFAVYFQSQMVDVGAIETLVQQEPAYKVTIVDNQHPNGVPLEQWGRPAQQHPVAVYGYCPECGAKGVTRERRPNGNDKCANGHTYSSSVAHMFGDKR